MGAGIDSEEPNSENKCQCGKCIHDMEFQIWRECEKIAMHFNELLIQLRTRALGGIGVITTLVGFFSQGEKPGEFNWGLMAAVLMILTIMWAAIFLLDSFYYNRLLRGAVNGILRIESAEQNDQNPKKIANVRDLKFSKTIEDAVKNPPFPSLDAKNGFYGLVFIALLMGMALSYNQHCKKLHNIGVGCWPCYCVPKTP